MKNKKEDKASGCLFGLALGDALGYPNEFLSFSEIKTKWGVKGFLMPKDDLITVSDDTQMTLAVAKAIQSSFNGEHIIKKDFETQLVWEFINWYADEDNDRDPGFTCLTVCERLAKGINWVESTSYMSKGCAANMRVAPVGLLSVKSEEFDEEHIGKIAQFQSAITHAHPTALTASELTAVCIHKILNGADTNQLIDILIDYCNKNKSRYHSDWLGDIWKNSGFDNSSKYISFGWEECLQMLENVKEGLRKYKKGNDPCKFTGEGWVAEQALGTALLCFLINPSDSVNVIKRAIHTNGDSDSIGCIAGALAGTHNSLEDLPNEWIGRIEYKQEIINYTNFLTSE